MTKRRSRVVTAEADMTAKEELAEEVAENTAELELEKLQRKLAREERKKRKEIELAGQKKARWLLPALLATMTILAFVFSNLKF